MYYVNLGSCYCYLVVETYYIPSTFHITGSSIFGRAYHHTYLVVDAMYSEIIFRGKAVTENNMNYYEF